MKITEVELEKFGLGNDYEVTYSSLSKGKKFYTLKGEEEKEGELTVEFKAEYRKTYGDDSIFEREEEPDGEIVITIKKDGQPKFKLVTDKVSILTAFLKLFREVYH